MYMVHIFWGGGFCHLQMKKCDGRNVTTYYYAKKQTCTFIPKFLFCCQSSLNQLPHDYVGTASRTNVAFCYMP
jgi:hypothetical protein